MICKIFPIDYHTSSAAALKIKINCANFINAQSKKVNFLVNHWESNFILGEWLSENGCILKKIDTKKRKSALKSTDQRHHEKIP